MPGWMNHKLVSKLPERGEKEKDWQEINLKYADDTTLMAESEEETESLDEGEREWTENIKKL